MSENTVRIHLKQAILVGNDEKARYAKVLVGKRDPSGDLGFPRVVFHSFVISGFVWGYRDTALSTPTRHRLSDSNILSVEDLRVEHKRPPAPMDAIWPWCANKRPHSKHTWTYSGSSCDDIECPGVEKDENSPQRPATRRDPLDICPLFRKSSSIHPGHHYHNQEGITIQCPGWRGR